MVGPILQIPGDCCFYRFDQPASRRVAEALISFQGEIDIFGEAFDETMGLGERRAAFEDDGLAVVGFVEAFEHPRDPVVFLHMDGRNPEMVCRGLDELQVRVGCLVQLHRIFQARDSGHSSGSMPRSKRLVGLSDALSAGNTSF